MINKLKKFKIFLERIYMFLCNKCLKANNKKIIFESFNGKQYSDNPRAISEMLHSMDFSLEICWLFSEYSDEYNLLPSYVEKKYLGHLERLKEIATAKVYISNQAANPNLYKSKKQLFIETWHGDRAFKKILYDANPNRPTKVYSNKVTDICLAGSQFGIDVYRTAFRYNGEVLNVGCPRNDILVNGDEKRKKQILKSLNIKDKKILLYAPTFRDGDFKEKEIEKIDFSKIKKILEEKTGESWIILLRSHHGSKGFNNNDINDFILNVTDYPDMADLLLITDFLITDYSSSALDFSLTNKPIILFISDYENYKNNCRSYKADPKKVGLLYAENENELEDLILNKNINDFKAANKKANEYYKTNETGTASKTISQIIIDFIYKNEKGE